MADQDAAAAAARKAMFGRKSLSRTEASAAATGVATSSAEVAGHLQPLAQPPTDPATQQQLQQPTSATTAALLNNPADIQRLLQEQHFQQQEAEQRARQQHLDEQQRRLEEQRATFQRTQLQIGSPLASPSTATLASPSTQPPLQHSDLIDQSVDPSAPSPAASSPSAGLGMDGLGWMQQSSMQAAPVTVYYSKDPISHLQIRVLLRKQPDDSTGSSVPKTFKQLNLAMKERQKKEEATKEAAALAAATTVPGQTSAAALNRSRGAVGSMGEEVVHADEAGRAHHLTEQRDALGRTILSPTHEAEYKPAVLVTQLFAWQQKVVSPAEIMLAALDPRGKQSASFTDQVANLVKAHFPHDDLLDGARKLLATQREGMMLSSKRDHDRYINPDDYLNKRVTTSQRRELNPLAERIVLAPLVNKRSDSHLTREGVSTPYHILATVDLPSDASQIQLLNRTSTEVDDHPPVVSGSFQKPLCTIKVTEGDEYCTLEMRPPFSMPQKDPTGVTFDDQEWYSFWTPSGDCYRYRIENYSAVIDNENAAASLDPTQKLMLAVESRTLDAELARMAQHEMQVKKHRSGREFDRGPLPGFETAHVFGEIVKTTGFIEESLSIAYEIDLRNNSHQVDAEDVWTTLVTDRLEAVTQSSQARFERHPIAGRGETRACYFSFPFEVKLSKRASTPALGPIIYFQVHSQNAWGMGSVAGYGFVHLPLTAGCHELTVDTWVPLGTIRDRKTKFFVGAGPTLRDVKLCGVTADKVRRARDEEVREVFVLFFVRRVACTHRSFPFLHFSPRSISRSAAPDCSESLRLAVDSLGSAASSGGGRRDSSRRRRHRCPTNQPRLGHAQARDPTSWQYADARDEHQRTKRQTTRGRETAESTHPTIEEVKPFVRRPKQIVRNSSTDGSFDSCVQIKRAERVATVSLCECSYSTSVPLLLPVTVFSFRPAESTSVACSLTGAISRNEVRVKPKRSRSEGEGQLALVVQLDTRRSLSALPLASCHQACPRPPARPAGIDSSSRFR